MYRILLLDIDRTLLDFQKSQEAALRKTFAEYGFVLTDEIRKVYDELNNLLWGQHEKGLLSREELIYSRFDILFRQVGLKGNGVAFEDTYQAYLGEGAYLIPGALEVVQYLAKKYRLYVVTNGVTVTQRQRLRASGLDSYMDDIFISEEIGSQKPQKEFFDRCFARIPHADKAGMLIIGDSLSSDIQGGINAGIQTCWYNPGGAEAPESIRPDLEIRSLEELYTIL